MTHYKHIPIQEIENLRDIAGDYDGFVIDWGGVIYNGVALYPEALNCLKELKKAGKIICILTNAPKLDGDIRDSFRSFGLDDHYYDYVVSSGQVTHDALRSFYFERMGKIPVGANKVYHIGQSRYPEFLDGLTFNHTDNVDEAAFILATLSEKKKSVKDYDEVLVPAAKRKIPMICANPDLTAAVDGNVITCAGLIAARYKKLGGEVIYIGKPHWGVYARSLKLLRERHGIKKGRILAIGDNIRTDIEGAVRNGISSLFNMCGIHHKELRCSSGPGKYDPVKLSRKLDHHKQRFDKLCATPTLRW